jgi:hypothetical protein
MTGSKVKSKLGPLAYRPGWHAGDSPIATHIGDLSQKQKDERKRVDSMREIEKDVVMATNAFKKMIKDKTPEEVKDIVNKLKVDINKKFPYPKDVSKPSLRPSNQVWAEVEMPADVDWQSEANKRGVNAKGKLVPAQAHITDQLPHGGHYRYKTNPNMAGEWIIGGAMRVNRVLNDREVEKLNTKTGVHDLPRLTPFNSKKYGF